MQKQDRITVLQSYHICFLLYCDRSIGEPKIIGIDYEIRFVTITVIRIFALCDGSRFTSMMILLYLVLWTCRALEELQSNDSSILQIGYYSKHWGSVKWEKNCSLNNVCTLVYLNYAPWRQWPTRTGPSRRIIFWKKSRVFFQSSVKFFVFQHWLSYENSIH